jgi:hypothetical protein
MMVSLVFMIYTIRISGISSYQFLLFMVFMGPDDIPDEKCSDSVTATAMG